MHHEFGDYHFRFCPSCGFESEPSDQFCQGCGTLLSSTVEVPASVGQGESSSAQVGRDSRLSRKSRIAAGAALLVVVAAIAVTTTTLILQKRSAFVFSAADAESLTWHLSHLPGPPGPRGSAAQLLSVSCPSSSFCMAVGSRQYYDQAASIYFQLPIVERFNGSRWTVEPVRSPDSTSMVGQLPEDQLTDVSCPTIQFCMAVGSFGRISTSTGLGVGLSGALVEIFNSGKWHAVQLETSSQSGFYASLDGTFCVEARSCLVVGAANSSHALQTLMSYKFENGSWTSVRFVRVSKETVDNLSHIYCSSISDCFAVGTTSFGTFGSSRAFAAVYSGHLWRFTNPLSAREQAAGVSDLSDDSCLPDGLCVTIGSVQTGPYGGTSNTKFNPIVKSFRSGKWHALISAKDSGFAGVSLDALDCLHDWCSIVGVQGTTLLVETYTASGWHLSPFIPSIPLNATFDSVSCSPDGRCVAVGYSPSGPLALVGSLPTVIRSG